VGLRPYRNEILLLRLVWTLPASPGHKRLSPKSLHSVEHDAGFHHRRVRTVRISLRSAWTRAGSEPISPLVWDDGAGPVGEESFRAEVWPTASARQRMHQGRALLPLRKRCLDPTNRVKRRLLCVWRGC
jgi:hypothetical protein